MDIYNFYSEYPFGANTYVISSGDEYAVIDPAASPEKVLGELKLSPLKFKYLILTHAHFDHILFVDEWTSLTKLPVTVSEEDKIMLGDSYLNCYELFLGSKRGYNGETLTVKDGDELPLGEIN